MKPDHGKMWGNLWEHEIGKARPSEKNPDIPTHSQPRQRFDSPYLHQQEGGLNMVIALVSVEFF